MAEIVIDREFRKLPYSPETAREVGWSKEDIERIFGEHEQETKGGPGSGHHGHGGRPGKRGGSSPGKAGAPFAITGERQQYKEPQWQDIPDVTWSSQDDESFGSNLVDSSRQHFPTLPLSEKGRIFRGSADKENPVRAVLEGSQLGLARDETREGIFATTNESEAAFYASVQAIVKGAKRTDDKWSFPEGVRPAIYEVVNAQDVDRWEFWLNPGSDGIGPFSGDYDEIIIKSLDTPVFVEVRHVTMDELNATWVYLEEKRPDILSLVETKEVKKKVDWMDGVIGRIIQEGDPSPENESKKGGLGSNFLSSLKSLLTAIKQTAGAERYRKDIWGAVQNLWNGSISHADFIGVMNQLIPIAFEQAWLEAVKDEGITSIDELEDEERAELQKRIDLELTFVEGFADWIIAHSKAEGFKLRSLAPRVNMWVARYMDIHDQAKQLAGGVKKYEFVYDPEKENCRSCLRLNGQVRRMSAWKKFDCRPKHPDLECMHSANGPTVCGCEFVETDKPASRGPLPKWRAV